MGKVLDALDKSPYKDWVGIGFWGGAKKTHHSGVYFGFSDDGGGMHVGSHNFSKEFLAAYRLAAADDESGSELKGILAGLGKGYKINGEQLKRVPPGFNQDHPRGGLLKFKSLYVSAPQLTVKDITGPNLVETCSGYFEELLPFHRWLFNLGETLD